MYKSTIEETGQKFKFPTKWSEITIGKFAEYQTLVKDLQKTFVKKFDLKDESEVSQVTTIEIFTIYPDYFVKLFSFWTGISLVDCYKVNKEDILNVYQTMNELLAKNMGERKIDRFEFDKITYLFPTSQKDIQGNEALMSKETFGAMIYAMQQDKILEDITKGKFDALGNQIAILCRPEGEAYNPEKVNERAKLFQDLSMDIVWQFSFFLIRLTPRFKRDTQIFLAAGEQETRNSQGSGGTTHSTKPREKT